MRKLAGADEQDEVEPAAEPSDPQVPPPSMQDVRPPPVEDGARDARAGTEYFQIGGDRGQADDSGDDRSAAEPEVPASGRGGALLTYRSGREDPKVAADQPKYAGIFGDAEAARRELLAAHTGDMAGTQLPP